MGLEFGLGARSSVRLRPPRVPRYAALQMRPGGVTSGRGATTPEAGTRTQYVQYVGARGQAALRLRYVQYEGGRSTWGDHHRKQGIGSRGLYVPYGGPGAYVSAKEVRPATKVHRANLTLTLTLTLTLALALALTSVSLGGGQPRRSTPRRCTGA